MKNNEFIYFIITETEKGILLEDVYGKFWYPKQFIQKHNELASLCRMTKKLNIQYVEKYSEHKRWKRKNLETVLIFIEYATICPICERHHTFFAPNEKGYEKVYCKCGCLIDNKNTNIEYSLSNDNLTFNYEMNIYEIVKHTNFIEEYLELFHSVSLNAQEYLICHLNDIEKYDFNNILQGN